MRISDWSSDVCSSDLTVTAVVPPYNASEAGGMEYPTFFTAEGYAKVEPGTIMQYMLDFVTIHEFGHGYFYGILASNEFEEPMLDEGMNQYWAGRMTRERGQKNVLASGWMKRSAERRVGKEGGSKGRMR